jgi:4'-phosphopantetheinyl transferase
MQLRNNEIHIYSASLLIAPDAQKYMLSLLNKDECSRAERFHSPSHQRRFIAAHAMLRMILGNYLDVHPTAVEFTFNKYHKPSLLNHPDLQFNMSHSDEMVVYAFTRTGTIGIDIEKFTDNNKLDLASRFFSVAEIAALSALSHTAQIEGFYHLWSRKEAIIKASGKGLTQPLSSFSVALHEQPQIVLVDGKNWILIPVSLHTEYASALAVAEAAASISIWDIIDQKPVFRSSINLSN